MSEQAHSEEEAISALDLADLNPHLGTVVRLLLRRGNLSREEIYAALGEPAPHATMSQGELDAALATLRERHWIVATGEGPRYRVHLGHRTGRARNASLWSALDL